MGESITRVTLFVPGRSKSLAAWNKALRPFTLAIENGSLEGAKFEGRVEVEWVDNDGAFGEAFSFGNVREETIATIDAAPGALVLHLPVDLRLGREAIVDLVKRLSVTGALGVRLEQSKAGWEIDRWLELFGSDDPWDWHRGAVLFVSGDGCLQSCGMHAFSLPDARIDLDGDQGELVGFAQVLNVYQLAEDPVLLSGQTFSPDNETPRRVVERWPDTEYPRDHACHNPYGVWRVGPPNGKSRPGNKLAHVFMPALRLILASLENKSGAPLDRAQVEAVRDNATCMAMEHAVAQKLERDRGYADIDPEYVFEQWQIVRG